MKTVIKIAVLALCGLSARAQHHRMWVNTNAASLREKPVATSRLVLKLGASAEVIVTGVPKGQWVRVLFTPSYDAGPIWSGWMEARSLVGSRDSVQVPASTALFTVAQDKNTPPRIPGYHQTFH